MANCSSCGLPIPDGQGRSCSMCYGDPGWGRDGYYQQYIEEQEQKAQEEANRAESEQRQEAEERDRNEGPF